MTDYLEQFGIGLEYHRDTTHFGKAKGESVTTNRVEGESQTDKLQFAKQCHKPSSLYYRCYCDERKEDEYCNGCRFWYESQTERSE